MDAVRKLEDAILRVESLILVALVVAMLGLAGYNVLYRNVLVPLQTHYATSGPPIERAPAPEPVAAPRADVAPAVPAGPPSDADEFGGGFGAPAEEAAPATAAGGDAEFDGGFGDPPPAAPSAPAAAGDDDFEGGFGAPQPAPAPVGGDDFDGGFGAPPAEPAGDAGEFGGGFGDGDAKGGAGEEGGFGGAGDAAPVDDNPFGTDIEEVVAEAEASAPATIAAPTGPIGGPPPEGSFAAGFVAFVDAIKLEWIDVFLRQLVILAAFFGAMFATQRGKHINVDALSKLLPEPVRKVVAIAVHVLTIGVCLILARSGWRFVELGREFPREVTPWLSEWQMQLMFPVAFGLLTFHFAIRLAEAVVALATGAPLPGDEPHAPAGPAPRDAGVAGEVTP